MRITFLLPGDGAAGGIRVTMQMGNRLIERGHDVRIAYAVPPLLSRAWLLSAARSIKYRVLGLQETRWLSQFKGRVERFVKLQQLKFSTNETVIATGEATNDKLDVLQADVLKLRYCHGIIERDLALMHRAWGGPMRTIAVSKRLVPTLEKYCELPVLGIVPNGLSAAEYFPNGCTRDGIGLIYSGHPVKGPEVAVALAKTMGERFREIPCYAFSSYPKPKGLEGFVYTRFPSIQEARDIYNHCKVWLVTSRDEGFSLPILEAMACGCAVVTSNHTNAADLIQDGVNGFTVEYGDVQAYMDRIGRLLGNEGLRTRVVEEGFKTVKRFSWENATDRMEEALERMAGCV